MARAGIFGWSYPPGVTGREPEITGEGPPCECCGNDPADCICPECPKCGQQGDPYCYMIEDGENRHGLIYNTEQMIGLCKIRIYNLKQDLHFEELILIQLQELLKKEKSK